MAKDNKDNKEKDSISEAIKKVVSIGVGAAFLTEDAVKNMLGDLPLPKDIVSGLVNNAKGAKEDLTKGVREEIRKYLTKMDVEKLVDYVAENYDVEVNATFKFNKKEGASSTPSKKKNE